MSEAGERTPIAKDGLAAIQASAHASLSNLISYSIVSGAAMLAFFFAFQATLLAYYPSIYSVVVTKAAMVGKTQIPLGKIAATFLCVLMLIFNYWSYKMVMTFNHYIYSYLHSGSALEKEAGLNASIYGPMLVTYEKYGRGGHGLYWTLAFFGVLSLVWITFAVMAWAS
jgi:hypothetical protein